MNVPIEASGLGVILNTEEAAPSGDGVTTESRTMSTPVGAAPTQEDAKVTGELNPLSGLTQISAERSAP